MEADKQDKDKYHRAGCKWLAESGKLFKLADTKGYGPCKVCGPPEGA